MKACLFLLLLISTNFIETEPKVIEKGDKAEPRVFFKQMAEASGLFPIEINVPDTIGSMMSGMSWMYETASSYFNMGGENGVSEDQGQQQQVLYDGIVTEASTKSKRQKKKVKKLQKKIKLDSELNMFDVLEFFMF